MKLVSRRSRGNPYITAAMKYGPELYKIGKKIPWSKLKLRFPSRKKKMSLGKTQDLDIGRRTVKIPVNLPKKLKVGKKHCNTLTKKSLAVFKSALVKKANFIYYYSGIFKASERQAYDNVSYAAGFSSSAQYKSSQIFGGALGAGFTNIDFTSAATLAASLNLENMNSLFICLDIPTGYFLPGNFGSDMYDGTNYYDRLFGMAKNNAFDTKRNTAFNSSEKGADLAAPDTYLLNGEWRVVYTLYYRYEFNFKNYTISPQICWVIHVKLNHIGPADSQPTSMNGMSNWINKYIDGNTETAYGKLRRGILPPCFKVVRKKFLILGPTGQSTGQQTNSQVPMSTSGVIVMKSPRDYVAAAKKPTTQDSDAVIPINEFWYDEKAQTYNYCIVYAVPYMKYACDNLNSYNNLCYSGEVACAVTKRTVYTVLTN